MKKYSKPPRGRKPLFIAVVILVAFVSFVFAYLYSTSVENITSANQCSGTCISLQAEKAVPDTVAVTRGSFVQFNSADGQSHSLSLGEGGTEHTHRGSFNSGTFTKDEGWRVQLNEEGTFIFHDHLNPNINILVVVYTPGKDYKIQP